MHENWVLGLSGGGGSPLGRAQGKLYKSQQGFPRFKSIFWPQQSLYADGWGVGEAWQVGLLSLQEGDSCRPPELGGGRLIFSLKTKQNPIKLAELGGTRL